MAIKKTDKFERIEDKDERKKALSIALEKIEKDFGKGAIKEIINELQSRHFQKILVTTGEDLLEFGVATKVTDLLRDAGINFEVYTDIKPNPTIENIKNGVDACKRFDAQAIVAIGGGSIIDASKAIGIIMTNPEFSDVRSLEGLAETKNKSLPIIAVSTTAGTAAEVTPVYSVDDIVVGNGDKTITKALQKEFFDLAHGRHELSEKFLAYVK